MSESNGTSVWVGDLDCCIGIGYNDDDDYDQDNDRAAQPDLLKIELDEIGELQLLAGRAISALQLYEKSIAPSEWRQAIHQSEMTIGFSSPKVLQQ